MNLSLFPTLKGYRPSWLVKDIQAGLIIAAVSIPISMGYAEVAGLPAVYGLYGSLLHSFPLRPSLSWEWMQLRQRSCALPCRLRG